MNQRSQFTDLQITKELLKAIESMGFEEPTPIQVLTIPLIKAGRDITAQAQTGTGKTAAFGIPLIESVNKSLRKVQILVLCPTRELAIQISEEFTELMRYLPRITVVPIYGGQPIERQLRVLSAGAHIIIGTPGRVIDHMRRGTLTLDEVTSVVLDEADQMLDMGFREDIEFILSRVPQKRQTLLFSATMPSSILEISKRFQNQPEFISIEYAEMTVPSIEQSYIDVKEKDKVEVLCQLIDSTDPVIAIVFCNTKRRAEELAGKIKARGYRAEELHGDMRQTQRDRVMGNFRKGLIDILIATDVAARGIDVTGIDMVINFDVPQDVEYYVHRIGRTGRAGKSGRAITFISTRDFTKLHEIQKYVKIKISRISVPTRENIAENKIRSLLEQAKSLTKTGGLENYLQVISHEIGDESELLEISAALVKMQIETGSRRRESEEYVPRDGEEVTPETGMVRFFIALGKRQNISPKDIVGAITGETGIPGRLIGTIKVLENYSFVEIPHDYASEVYTIMREKTIRNQPTGIEVASAKRG